MALLEPALPPAVAGDVPVDLAAHEELVAQARDFVRDARAANTLRAYRSDWADFQAWCARRGYAALPAEPETVALNPTDLATARGCAVATIERRLSAIAQWHKLRSYVTPTRDERVRLVLGGIRRRLGTAQDAKAPAITEDVLAMVAGLPLSAAELPTFIYRHI